MPGWLPRPPRHESRQTFTKLSAEVSVPKPLTMLIIAIIASGVVSLTLTPLMCARMLAYRGHGTRKTLMERAFGAVERRVLNVYGRSLWFFLRHRWISALIWVLCLGGTVYLFQKVPMGFIPSQDMGQLQGQVEGPQGIGFQAMMAKQDLTNTQPTADLSAFKGGSLHLAVKGTMPTEYKLRWIDALYAAGVRESVYARASAIATRELRILPSTFGDRAGVEQALVPDLHGSSTMAMQSISTSNFFGHEPTTQNTRAGWSFLKYLR